MPKRRLQCACRTLLVARELNDHRRWYVFSFASPLHLVRFRRLNSGKRSRTSLKSASS
jgi:hypothetical protein